MPFLSDSLPQRLISARAAAREGARMLREEFHRPGGPRGYGDHADIDGEVENRIRELLTPEYPADGFLGEETGFHLLGEDPAPPRAIWVVDPNDGTSTFLKGFRGSAVSIALVVEGRPVVGVVHSWDGDGDEFCWAENTPFLRNGQPVQREWPTQADNDGLALLSHVADRKALMNSHCVAPMRYRTMPSIAMRMALVAAGDGDLTVSLGGPVAWDLAAGHALLRGAGGQVVNGQGHPIVYDARGNCNSDGRLFCGAPALLEWLRTRPWNQIPESPLDPGTPGLCWPRPALPGDRTCRPDHARLERAQGCLLGQLAGDALGSLVEFQSAERIRKHFPTGVRDLQDGGSWNLIAGQPTDDSEMALMLARTLVTHGEYKQAEVLRAYQYWRDSEPFDMGRTTRAGLEGRPNAESQANGSLMRVSPLGIFCASRPELAGELALADARLTHPHPVCGQAGALLVRAIAHAIQDGPGALELHASILGWASGKGQDPRLAHMLTLPENATAGEFSGPESGWVLLALRNAVWQLKNAGGLEEALVDTVGRGGDTDTNAAITGALLGAVYGIAAVPRRWQRAILSCRPLRLEGLPQVVHPRPRAFWPVDALMLAERLLAG